MDLSQPQFDWWGCYSIVMDIYLQFDTQESIPSVMDDNLGLVWLMNVVRFFPIKTFHFFSVDVVVLLMTVWHRSSLCTVVVSKCVGRKSLSLFNENPTQYDIRESIHILMDEIASPV